MVQAEVTKMKVPFLDLRVADAERRSDLLAAVEGVFSHGRLVMGPEVGELEEQLAKRCGRKFAVGVGSGTDALFLAVKALGLDEGDEIITTSLSWVATANAIVLNGLVPVFADIGEDLNIDPDSVAGLISERTRAIMPVHFTGKVCAMGELEAIAKEHGLMIIEDACQAFDARLGDRRAGSFGLVSCFSMNPMKVFAAAGEAGMVLTDDEEVYRQLVALRYNGTVNREVCIEASLNGRLDTLQAAILLRRLLAVEQIIAKRRQIARWYDEQLAQLVEVPREEAGQFDIYYTYTIRTPRRDELKSYLEEQGVETKIQHAPLMPDQPVYAGCPRAEIANARRLIGQVLCIPANEKLERADVDYVADCIKRFFRER